jgi:hypothetical protein
MINDEDDAEIESLAGQIIMPEDKVSSRTMAYISLMEAVKKIKNDDELKAESMNMLKRIRLSISAMSDAPMDIHKGGKH